MDAGKQCGVRIGLGERHPNLAESDPHLRPDLEELQPNRVALGLGEVGRGLGASFQGLLGARREIARRELLEAIPDDVGVVEVV